MCSSAGIGNAIGCACAAAARGICSTPEEAGRQVGEESGALFPRSSRSCRFGGLAYHDISKVPADPRAHWEYARKLQAAPALSNHLRKSLRTK